MLFTEEVMITFRILVILIRVHILHFNDLAFSIINIKKFQNLCFLIIYEFKKFKKQVLLNLNYLLNIHFKMLISY